MVDVLKLFNRLKNLPFGKWMFSVAVCYITPYFGSIRPRMQELRVNYGHATMRKRHSVTNHIKTVHAIAMCNLCEFVAGLTIEASIPSHLRWIPASMEIFYLKKATTDLSATCEINIPDWDAISECPIEVSVKDKKGVEVVKAVIKMYVSKRKSK